MASQRHSSLLCKMYQDFSQYRFSEVVRPITLEADSNLEEDGSVSSTRAKVLRKLISANHILHKHAVVDGFGFIAARNPERSDTYLISGYCPPALVEGPEDIIEYYVADSSPVDPNAKKGYSERFIMGELFRRFPQIQATVHSHANEVLPYCCTDVPLHAVFHMGGFLGQHVPVWDIREVYDSHDMHQQDMLVNNQTFGESLAASFTKAGSGTNTLDYNVVLQSRHGYATHGPDIETAVYRAIYTKTNASILTDSIILKANTEQGSKLGSGGTNVESLSARHAADCQKMNEGSQDKAWRLWLREVQVDPLYHNRLDDTAETS